MMSKMIVSARKRKILSTIALYIAYTVFILVFLMPIIWMFSTSLKPEAQVLSYPPRWIPKSVTLENYREVITALPNFFRWFFNSIVVGVGTVLLTVFLSALASYGFARLRFKGRDIIFLGVIASLLLPVQLTIVPLFLFFTKLRLADTYISLILPSAANAFGVFLLRQFFMGIPYELTDAAKIDGCSELGIFFRVVLPLSRNALMAVTIFVFMWSWNSFLWPLIIINADEMRTLPLGLALRLGVGDVAGGTAAPRWGIAMAGSFMASLPAIVFYLLLQRHFRSGIALTGIKG